MASAKRIIMYLEDDDTCAYLFQRAVHELNYEAQIHRVVNVVQALAFLQQQGEYANAPRPHVAVLDINVPGGSGLSILRTIRSSEVLARLPVVIFSSSVAVEDRNQAQMLGADEFIVKSSEFITAAQTALRLAA